MRRELGLKRFSLSFFFNFDFHVDFNYSGEGGIPGDLDLCLRVRPCLPIFIFC